MDMQLTEKVQEILIKLGETELAESTYIIQLLSEKFYDHFQNDIINHTPIKEFIIQEVKKIKVLN